MSVVAEHSPSVSVSASASASASVSASASASASVSVSPADRLPRYRHAMLLPNPVGRPMSRAAVVRSTPSFQIRTPPAAPSAVIR